MANELETLFSRRKKIVARTTYLVFIVQGIVMLMWNDIIATFNGVEAITESKFRYQLNNH